MKQPRYTVNDYKKFDLPKLVSRTEKDREPKEIIPIPGKLYKVYWNDPKSRNFTSVNVNENVKIHMIDESYILDNSVKWNKHESDLIDQVSEAVMFVDSLYAPWSEVVNKTQKESNWGDVSLSKNFSCTRSLVAYKLLYKGRMGFAVARGCHFIPVY